MLSTSKVTLALGQNEKGFVHLPTYRKDTPVYKLSYMINEDGCFIRNDLIHAEALASNFVVFSCL